MSTSMTIEDSRNEGAAHALERAAYHEAGHAVVALEFHRPFRQVSIIPDEDSLSPVMKVPRLESIRPDNDNYLLMPAWIEHEAMFGLAGPIAEAELTDHHHYVGASSDYRDVVDLVRDLYGYDEVLSKWLDYMVARTRAFIRHPRRWVKIEALAAELLIHKRLSAERAQKICHAAWYARAGTPTSGTRPGG